MTDKIRVAFWRPEIGMFNIEEDSVTVKDYSFLFEVDAVKTDEGKYVTMLNPDTLVEVRDLIDTHLSQMREEIDEATREYAKEKITVAPATERKKRAPKGSTGRGKAKSAAEHRSRVDETSDIRGSEPELSHIEGGNE